MPALAGSTLHRSVPKAQQGPGWPAAPQPPPPSLCCKISFKGWERFSLSLLNAALKVCLLLCKLASCFQGCIRHRGSLKNKDAERSTLPDQGAAPAAAGRAGRTRRAVGRPGCWEAGPGLRGPCQQEHQAGGGLQARAWGLALGFPAHTHQVMAMRRCGRFKATVQVS